MTTKARLSSALIASHLWALNQARAAVHASLSNHDHALPPLAERRVLQVPGAVGPLEARLYRPDGVAEDAPLLLFFHGGGFIVSDLDTHEPLCIRLADAGRMRVLSASYRLAPESRFPAQLDDALAVGRWVLGEGVSVVLAERGVAIGGDSAGGYLAALAAAELYKVYPERVRAQLLLYPLLQLDNEGWSKGLLKDTRLLGLAAVAYINAQLARSNANAPSIVSAAQLAPVPTLIAGGGPLDPCKADSVVLADALRAAGRTVIWRDYPSMIHGFGNLTHVSETARRAVAEIGVLVGEMLG